MMATIALAVVLGPPTWDVTSAASNADAGASATNEDANGKTAFAAGRKDRKSKKDDDDDD
ncbi:hypothetical protein [Ottowia testudinis]|uniref:Uncharacterized protein n=1 Tax=Ottowia testudinis TaxID=2816950 RepID=A0A975CDF7_9BURK|nr:hypothetical protein [Ottowia testudinis]QTD44423.1 hypothetical protein J1M35_15140 [Ottowia testudinis]